MNWYLIKNSDKEIDIDCDKPVKIANASVQLHQDKSIVINTNNNEQIVYNGYKLLPNSQYDLKENDIFKIGIDTYNLKNRSSNNQSSQEEKLTMLKKEITSFFKPSILKNVIETPFTSITGKWENVQDKSLLIFTPDSLENSKKIAAFDLDGTLIKTKSGKRFAEDHNDWTLAYSTVCKELVSYYHKKFKLVIFTNQLPLNNDSAKQSEFKQKIANIFDSVKLPIQIFAATKRDMNRKPRPGMWIALEYKNEISIDIEKSFYVGDAAGRPKAGSAPKDHSYADLLFAKNIGIAFQTPEEFFLKTRCVNLALPQFKPEIAEVSAPNFRVSGESEVIVMVGPPGSGKSTFCERYLVREGYVRVNRDKLGSWQNCAKLVEDSLRDKLRVVVDNTNRDKVSRKRFVDIAAKFRVPCRCFIVSVDKNRAMHNNKFRELTQSDHVVVSEVIIHSFYKYFEEPIMDEGFKEIVKINLGPIFQNDNDKKLYNMYLLDKYQTLTSSL